MRRWRPPPRSGSARRARRALAFRAHQQRVDVDAGELARFAPRRTATASTGPAASASRSQGGWPRAPLRIAAPRNSPIIAVRFLDAERGDAEGHVAQHLDKDAAEAEQHDRAEHARRAARRGSSRSRRVSIGDISTPSSVACGARAVTRSISSVVGGAGLGRRHVEHDAADFGLVGDLAARRS